MRQVVVTGGGTGIGLAVARRFTGDSRFPGDEVTILGRRADVLQAAAAEVGAKAVACDAADPASVHAALDSLPASVDVLVNNAGGNTDLTAGGEDGTLDGVAAAWRRNLDANVLSAVLITTALRSRFAPGARVINLGSIAARTGSGSYGAAKAALEAWTVDLAAELGTHGGTANVVSPGLTEDTEFFAGKLTDERRQRLVAATRTGRASTPADIAGMVHFLAGPDAEQVSGQVLHVNGGAHLGR